MVIEQILMQLVEAGRTVSAANEGKIRAAIAALQEIINKLAAKPGAMEEADRQAIAEARELLEAEFSFDDKRQLVRTALKAKYPTVKYGPWVNQMWDSYCVFDLEDVLGKSKLYKISYVIGDNNVVTLGDPIEVVVKTTYEPVMPGITEAEGDPLSDEFVPLVEAAVRRDGTIPLKVIAPGWGSSGHYSKETLEAAAPKYKKGTKMYWNHPTVSEAKERPERNLRDLAAEFVSDGRFEENGPAGPGIYADAKVFGPYKEAVAELAPHIGVSHRATGKAKQGEAEGRKGPIIESIEAVQSVDFVTSPGAGGQILQLFEAAREKEEIKSAVYGDKTKLEEVKKLTEEQIRELEESNRQTTEENARLKEAIILRDARDFVAEELQEATLPEITKSRLVESLSKSPAVKDGSLDKETYKQQITEAIKAETDYIATLTGSGRVRGMGPGGVPSDTIVEEAEKSLEDSFSRLGLSESESKIAAQGRR